MLVVFVSNYFNHHQKYVSDALFKHLGVGNFYFVATETISRERLALGYPRIDAEYVLDTMHSAEDKERAVDLINRADWVIIGSAPLEFYLGRLEAEKKIFYYSERIFKRFEPHKFFLRMMRYRKKANSQTFLLCSSAYTYHDYKMFGLYRGRSYKWGYFPRCDQYDNPELLFGLKAPLGFLWCGRFLAWKRPKLAIDCLSRLRKLGYNATLTMIGDGPLLEPMKKYVEDKGLNDFVSFLGGQSPDDVRREMIKHSFFLFTSNQNEGWGAVLNEAMNSGCVVVASDKIGAAPYLIKDGENGFLFRSNSKKDFFGKMLRAVENDAIASIRYNAYNTIRTLWSPEVAAERLVEVMKGIDSGIVPIFEEGPLSKAD